MHTEPRSPASDVALRAESRALKAFLSIAAVMAAVFLVFWQTSASMVDTWIRSETYKHCFLVVPAVLWFVWQERNKLAATQVAPWWPGLVGVAGAGFLWLAGELASALAPTQWAVVLMIQSAVLALFGWGWGRVLVFPLGFLFFAVPFGEAFTPTLIDWTADFTVAALAASGIPVFREGQHFVIPSGRWSVVEACSGIRYLMASVMAGTLFAWMIYRSPLRRVLFIGAAILVPIVANWLRAYLIVMIGHLSSNRLAVGVDHFIYGWVFFGLVIGAMFWIGARWREDHEPVPLEARPVADAAGVAGPVWPSVAIVAALAVAVVVWPLAKAGLLATGDKRPVDPAPISATGGWTVAPAPATDWRPALEGPASTVVATFARDGATVTAVVGYYRDQQQGRELVNALNRLVSGEGEWQQIGGGQVRVALNDGSSAVRSATLLRGAERLRVWHWYWLDGRVEISDARAKLSLAKNRMLLQTDTSAWIALATRAETDAEGDRVLAAFAREMVPSLNAALAATSSR